MSRQYTTKQVQTMFLARCWGIVGYWAEIQSPKTVEERISGAVFSILAMIDGAETDIPGFKLIPAPHPDDKEYNQSRGFDWFPDRGDIAGTLHEHFYKQKPEGQR